ncbi:hypothetical protein F2Q70_00026683 [Brassica cretica]|uniref:ACT domain-containing protein n=1 Tax=Brassica cretica TaxID=69181 RepID=A0A8S9L9H5_BRACR|nr:hypothetical protein F2Q70_00026683 [Brassica cretica]
MPPPLRLMTWSRLPPFVCGTVVGVPPEGIMRTGEDVNPPPTSTVSATRLGDHEMMVQISSSKIHNFWISNVLSGLEEDGIVLVDVSLSRSQGERVFYTLHLQVDNIDNDKLNCTELSQMMLYLYEECGNSY